MANYRDSEMCVASRKQTLEWLNLGIGPQKYQTISNGMCSKKCLDLFVSLQEDFSFYWSVWD